MADDRIQLNTDGTGKNLDTESLIGVGGNTVHRERHQVAGVALLEIARVLNLNPAVSDYALATRQVPKTWKSFNVLANGAGDNSIVAAVIGKRIKVQWFTLQHQGVNDITWSWKDGAAITIFGTFNLSIGGAHREEVSFPANVMETTAGNALILNLSAAENVRVIGRYYDDDAA